VDLRDRDVAAFVCEAEAEAVKIVGKYVSKTETLRSWDICGSDVRSNHVFELNNLPYGPYPEGYSDDTADLRGKQVKHSADEGPSRDRAPGVAVRKRKLGMTDEELGQRATDCFLGIPGNVCGSRGIDVFVRAPGNLFAHDEGYQGRWPRNDSIPRAAGEDFFYVSIGSRPKDFSLRKEYWCCCVGSDGERPPGCATEEASGPHRASGPAPGSEVGATQREGCHAECRDASARCACYYAEASFATTRC
jgi:hypothetical protein